jgi:DNA polymerase III alpha subunit
MTLELKGRRIDPWGNVIFTEQGLTALLLKDGNIQGLLSEGTSRIEKYNQLCKEFDHPEDCVSEYVAPEVPIEEFDKERQEQWLMPESYKNIDVKEFLLAKCETVEEVSRVLQEWELFEARNMENVLRQLIYLIDHFRENEIVWGVGRGSSVASYSLYLIGVHRIDSIKYDLDIGEFLK